MLTWNRNPHFISHPDQVSEGARAHLSHELAAMDFHRCLTSSNFAGYLFVGPTRNNQRQHFPFARCQRFKAFPQGGNFGFLRTSGPVSVHRSLNGIQQILITERLGKEFNRSHLHGSHSHLNISMGSNEDDGNVNVGLPEFALDIEPTYAG